MEEGVILVRIRFIPLRLAAIGTFACWLMTAAPAPCQVRQFHTRDFTRLSQVQVAPTLKRSDFIFILPVRSRQTESCPAIGIMSRRSHTPWPWAMS